MSPVGHRPIWESLGEEGAAFDVIDGFAVLGRLGEGGMGEVFRARQLSTGREVAIKCLRASVPLSRFQQEVSMLSRIHHPGVVGILHAGEWRGHPYYVMDYVAGPDLAHRARVQPFTPGEAAALIANAARAVHHAHARDILHRDIKPQNLLLAPDGSVRVTDFGLARPLTPADAGLTTPGMLLGTPGYMAPEQVRGDRDREGAATDVYGLGATLYHLLTGAPPFRADSIEAAFHLILDADPVSPRLLNPAVDPDLETVVLGCLEKDPGRRYPTAEALADELDRWMAGKPVHRRPPGAWGLLLRWARREPMAAAWSLATGLTLLLGLAGTTWMWRNAVRSKEAAWRAERDEIHQRRLAELHSDGRRVMSDIFRGMVEDLLPLAKKADQPDALLQVWDRAGVEARERLAAQPALAAEVFRQVGENFYHAGRTAEAARWLTEAHQRIRSQPGWQNSLEYAAIAIDLADWPGLEQENGVERAREALEIVRRQLPPTDPMRVSARLALVRPLMAEDRLDEAEAQTRLALEEVRGLPRNTSSAELTARAHQRLGEVLLKRGAAAAAATELTRALEAAASAGPAARHLIIYLHIDAGAALLQDGRPAEAAVHAEAARSRVDAEFGPLHGTSIAAHSLEARVAARLGDPARIRDLNHRGLAMGSQLATRQPEHLEAAVRWTQVPLNHGAFDETRALYRHWLEDSGIVARAPARAWIDAGTSVAIHAPWSGPHALREAARLFAQARQRDPLDLAGWAFELVCRAALNDAEAFHRLCRDLPDESQPKGSSSDREQLARALLLLPDAALALPRARLLIRPAPPESHAPTRPWRVFLEALIALRAAELPQAASLAVLAADHAAHVPECQVGAWSLLALAEVRRGDRAAALRHLEKAEALARHKDPWVLGHASLQWAGWATARTLEREARAAVME